MTTCTKLFSLHFARCEEKPKLHIASYIRRCSDQDHWHAAPDRRQAAPDRRQAGRHVSHWPGSAFIKSDLWVQRVTARYLSPWPGSAVVKSDFRVQRIKTRHLWWKLGHHPAVQGNWCCCSLLLQGQLLLWDPLLLRGPLLLARPTVTEFFTVYDMNSQD